MASSRLPAERLISSPVVSGLAHLPCEICRNILQNEDRSDDDESCQELGPDCRGVEMVRVREVCLVEGRYYKIPQPGGVRRIWRPAIRLSGTRALALIRDGQSGASSCSPTRTERAL